MIDPFEEFSDGEQTPKRLEVMELLDYRTAGVIVGVTAAQVPARLPAPVEADAVIRRYRQLLAAVLLALSASPVFAATAYLQPAAIFEGDITELVIEYESNVAALYALDTGPLAADFEILHEVGQVVISSSKSMFFRIPSGAIVNFSQLSVL